MDPTTAIRAEMHREVGALIEQSEKFLKDDPVHKRHSMRSRIESLLKDRDFGVLSDDLKKALNNWHQVMQPVTDPASNTGEWQRCNEAIKRILADTLGPQQASSKCSPETVPLSAQAAKIVEDFGTRETRAGLLNRVVLTENAEDVSKLLKAGFQVRDHSGLLVSLLHPHIMNVKQADGSMVLKRWCQRTFEEMRKVWNVLAAAGFNPNHRCADGKCASEQFLSNNHVWFGKLVEEFLDGGGEINTENGCFPYLSQFPTDKVTILLYHGAIIPDADRKQLSADLLIKNALRVRAEALRRIVSSPVFKELQIPPHDRLADIARNPLLSQELYLLCRRIEDEGQIHSKGSNFNAAEELIFKGLQPSELRAKMFGASHQMRLVQATVKRVLQSMAEASEMVSGLEKCGMFSRSAIRVFRIHNDRLEMIARDPALQENFYQMCQKLKETVREERRDEALITAAVLSIFNQIVN